MVMVEMQAMNAKTNNIDYYDYQYVIGTYLLIISYINYYNRTNQI